MDALPPSQGGGSSGSGSGGSGAPNGKAPNGNGQAAQPIIELFGSDLYTAGLVLVLMMLGLMHASMTRCTC
jgi:hypothetical protein